VRRTHARFYRAERMFDRLAALTHGLRVRVKALMHRSIRRRRPRLRTNCDGAI
jgi:hypothetical protein